MVSAMPEGAVRDRQIAMSLLAGRDSRANIPRIGRLGTLPKSTPREQKPHHDAAALNGGYRERGATPPPCYHAIGAAKSLIRRQVDLIELNQPE